MIDIWHLQSFSSRTNIIIVCYHDNHYFINIIIINRFSLDGNLLCCIGQQSITLYNAHSLDTLVTQSCVNISIVAVLFISSNRYCSYNYNYNYYCYYYYCYCVFISMATCGCGNIRIWRIKDNQLKSSSINIDNYHDVMFTDIGYHNNSM